MKVNTANKNGRQVLSELVDLLNAEGAYLNPKLSVRESQSDFRIYADRPVKATEQLIALPDRLLPKLADFEFKIEAEKFSAVAKNKGPSLIQIRLLQLMEELYDIYGKAKDENNCWPAVSYASHHELLDLLLPAVNANFLDIRRCQSLDEVRLSNFLTSRANRYSSSEFMMTLLEFMNNHPNAGAYLNETISGEEVLSVRHVPAGESKEVFVSYYPMDALETYVKFGYFEPMCYYVRSQPFDLELPGLPLIRVGNSSPKSDQKPPHSWQSQPTYSTTKLFTSRSRVEDGAGYLPYLFVPNKHHINSYFESLKEMLRDLEVAMGLSYGQLNSAGVVEKLSQKLVEFNTLFYKRLGRTLVDGKSVDSSNIHDKLLLKTIKYQLKNLELFAKQF